MTAYRFGLLALRPPKVELRVIRHISTDLRDHHLRARWARLMLRWSRG